MPDQRCAFVVRLWRPAPRLADPSPAVRGSLQLADSTDIRYFSSLDDLPDLLRELTGWRAGDSFQGGCE